jgi:phosphatidylserine/phosphatidylglycerophosphate/cardiolipin synthase-like enzyme
MEPISIIAQQYARVVIPLVQNADDSIRIIMFDWRWYPTISATPISQFNSEIVKAIKRGVSVKALVTNEGVATRLKAHGAQARTLHSKRTLHTKMLLIDDQKVVLGSHNFSQRAFSLNEEASIYVKMSSPQNDFVKYFDALWGV